ncbi:MAG TPA: arginine N-succinyltransferase [Tepidisphaeraceae bacterium]|jgi:arginine N-succinyltransferase
MVVVRPIRLEDLQPLFELVKFTGFGLTTLPRDEALLRRRIEKSLVGFNADKSAQPRTYLFAMEDAGQLIGICGVVSQVGGVEPFYTYRVQKNIIESKQLGVRKEIEALHLSVLKTGPSEIGSLFLSPQYRHDGNGRLLSLCRFLFMADHLDYFNDTVIAEMRGVVDAQGNSPFWEAVGRNFFEVDFPKADYLSMDNKQFIADLMPKHPIYIPLLPKEARDVLGKVHPDTQPALKMLQSEGFADANMRDLFEGGPTIQCEVKKVRAIRESMKIPVGEIICASSPSPCIQGEGRGGGTASAFRNDPLLTPPPEYKGREKGRSVPMIITNTRLTDFRACKATVEVRDGKARIESNVAEALQVKVGEPIRFVTGTPAQNV